MYIDRNALLSSLTDEDIKKICIELGSPTFKKSGETLCFNTCICHGGDSPYKLIYYPKPSYEYQARKYGMFKCFTCNDSFDIIELVIRAFKLKGKTMTWYKALNWVARFVGKLEMVSIEQPDLESIRSHDQLAWMQKVLQVQNKKSVAIPRLNEINENILEIFDYTPHEIWLKEHITRESLGRFEIGYWGENNAITIPHRDMTGRLIGLRLRYLDAEDIQNIGKYVPAIIEGEVLSHSLGSNLYGLHVVKDKIIQSKKIMLVEGEKSCLQAYSYFGEDSFCVATCGSNITRTQIKIMLQELKVSEVIVGFDKEYRDPNSFEAELYYQKLLKKVEPLVPFVNVSLVLDTENKLDYKDSPTDKGRDVLMELMDNKIRVTIDDIAKMKEGIHE